MNRRRENPLVAGLPLLWLAAFVLVPLGIVVKISLSTAATAQPPYRPHLPATLDVASWRAFADALTLDNFATVLGDDLYREAALRSLAIAAGSTALIACLGLPVALALARASRRWRPILLALVILPFWTSFLIRVYAWIVVLGDDGLVNAALVRLGIIAAPLHLLNGDGAVVLGIVYAYCPFMILPLFASLDAQAPDLAEAAADLGASRLVAFWTVTFPLARPGLVAGSLLCFIPIVGEFVVPDLLGGSDTLMLGRALWSEFFSNRDWPLAAAVAVVLVVLLVGPIVLFRRAEWERAEARL